jgi:hypothetical protein
MYNFNKKVSTFSFKVFIVLLLTLLINNVTFDTRVEAATKDDALSAAINFLKAQKKCDIETMANHSKYFRNIVNVKEFYSKFCNENPLQSATITNFNLINENTAFVSIQSVFKDTIHIRTSPVVKEDGKWKIILGIPPSGVRSTTNLNKEGKEAEVEQLFKDYANAIKGNDISKLKSFIKVVPDKKVKIDEHLKALIQEPIPMVDTFGVNIISDSLAIAQIETKYQNHSYTQNIVTINENGQWKIIFGLPLTNSFIPKGAKSIKIK